MIKVMIADDQALLRESMSYILGSDTDIKIVATAENGEKVIALCKENPPDVILMDIEMPLMNGLSATKLIKEKYPNIKIIILTTFDDSEYIMDAFLLGADGYVVKDINHEELILTVKCVHKGLTVIHESVKDMMISRFRGLANGRNKYKDILTEDEIEIVRLVGVGKNNKDIAKSLNYSEGTIKNKVSKLYEKLKLSDRMQLAIYAIDNEII